MMSNLKRYKLKLITVGPVFIGSGETYTPKEYIYMQDGSYYFPDMGKLYKKITSLNSYAKREFKNFLLGENRYRRKGKASAKLDELLNNLNLDVHPKEYGGYLVSANKYLDDPKNLNDIDAFIKNGLLEPYIPGSSLKGALRTIILNDNFVMSALNNNNIDLTKLRHNIRVSDSQPLSSNDLIMVQKYDYNRHKRRYNPLPLYREALKPGVEVSFYITCEGKLAQAIIASLEVAAKKWYQAYYKKFLGELSKSQKDNLITFRKDKQEVERYLYLGGGTGHLTKVKLPNDYRRPSNKRIPMQGDGTYKLTKAPFTRSQYRKGIKPLNKDNIYEMGKCYFEIKEE